MSVVKNDLFNSAEKSCPSKYSIDTFESIQSVQTGLSQLVYGFDVYNCLNLFCFYYSPFFPTIFYLNFSVAVVFILMFFFQIYFHVNIFILSL